MLLGNNDVHDLSSIYVHDLSSIYVHDLSSIYVHDLSSIYVPPLIVLFRFFVNNFAVYLFFLKTVRINYLILACQI